MAAGDCTCLRNRSHDHLPHKKRRLGLTLEMKDRKLQDVESPLLAISKRANRWRGVIGLAVLAPCGAAAALSPANVSRGGWAELGFDVAGWFLFVAGALLRWWATLYVESRKDRALVDEGPYSICRNPLYLGTFFMVVAIAAYLKSVTFVAGALVATLLYLAATLPIEERRLSDQFGEQYQRYAASVPRWWPRLGRLRTSPTIQVSVDGLGREARRAARWAWIPPLCELFSLLRQASWWPHPFNVL